MRGKVRLAVLRARWTWRFSSTSRAEMRARIAGLSDQTRPWWGEGIVIRHITPSLFQPVSLCLRLMEGVSSEPQATLIGITCPRCAWLWRKAHR